MMLKNKVLFSAILLDYSNYVGFMEISSTVGVTAGTTSVLIFRVKNQQFIGSGLPFIITGPLASKLND